MTFFAFIFKIFRKIYNLWITRLNLSKIFADDRFQHTKTFEKKIYFL